MASNAAATAAAHPQIITCVFEVLPGDSDCSAAGAMPVLLHSDSEIATAGAAGVLLPAGMAPTAATAGKVGEGGVVVGATATLGACNGAPEPTQ